MGYVSKQRGKWIVSSRGMVFLAGRTTSKEQDFITSPSMSPNSLLDRNTLGRLACLCGGGERELGRQEERGGRTDWRKAMGLKLGLNLF